MKDVPLWLLSFIPTFQFSLILPLTPTYKIFYSHPLLLLGIHKVPSIRLLLCQEHDAQKCYQLYKIYVCSTYVTAPMSVYPIYQWSAYYNFWTDDIYGYP